MRNMTRLMLAALVAIPVAAQTPQNTALDAAVLYVPSVVLGTVARGTAGLKPGDYAIAEETIHCDEAFLSQLLTKWYSDPIAQELAVSYRDNGTERARIHSDATTVPILALDQFSKGENEYDWVRLRSAYPAVRGIVRMSLPAMDSQSVFAIAHYEVITPEGRSFANFHNIVKQSDGSWRVTSGWTGNLRVAANGSETTMP